MSLDFLRINKEPVAYLPGSIVSMDFETLMWFLSGRTEIFSSSSYPEFYRKIESYLKEDLRDKVLPESTLAFENFALNASLRLIKLNSIWHF